MSFKLCTITLTTFALLFPGVSLHAWTPVTVNMNPPIIAAMPGWQTVCMVPDIHSAVIASGFQEISSEPSNAVMAYNIGLNRWDFLDVGPAMGGPQSDYISVAGHDEGASCYDENLHAFVTPMSWAMGSVSENMCQYDIRGNIGRAYYPVPFSKPYTSNMVFTCYDSDSNCIYFLDNGYGGRLSRYRPSENSWKYLSTCPDTLLGPDQSICYDKTLKRVLIPGKHCYNPATNLWETSPVPALSKYVVYNSVTRQTVSITDVPHQQPSPTRSIIFDPYTNKYFHIDMGGSLYTPLVKEQAGESGTPLQKPVFTRQSYQMDTRWTSLADGIQYDPLGFAQTPVITSHQNSLFMTWTEWAPASYPPTCYSATAVSRWNGSSWSTQQVLNAYSSYPTMVSCDTSLYLSMHADFAWSGTHSSLMRVSGGDKIDTLKDGGPINNARMDGSALPQLVSYRGRLNMLYLYQYPWRTYASMGHAAWNKGTSRWETVNNAIIAARLFFDQGNPAVFNSVFSAKPFGDSIIAAVTISQVSDLPKTLSLWCYNGTAWKTFPSPSLIDTAHVCVFPCLATDTVRHSMYIGYTRRPFVGRKNNNLVVEQWTGSDWQPLGGILNVNDSTKDGWAFRPSLAVSPSGVLYVAWTEHVWGSCPQVYVAHWSGSAWVRDFAPGGTLNNDGTNGSAQSVSLTFDGDKPTVAWAEHVFGGGSFRKIYVKQLSDNSQGETLENSGPGSCFLRASPNPFNPSSRIQISLPLSSPIRLEVYDAAGCLVRSLMGGTVAAGTHTLEWNGTNHAGKRVGAGLYVYRLKIGSRILTAKTLYAK